MNFLHSILLVFQLAAPDKVSLVQMPPAKMLEQVEQQVLKIEANAKRLTNRQRENAESLADGLRERLEGVEAWSDLSRANREKVINQYESMRALADGSDARENQQICKRQKLSGTNITQTVCRSVSQRDQTRERSREVTREIQDVPIARTNE